jgi:hypothetical protein
MSSTHQLRHELLVPEALLRRLINNFENDLRATSAGALASSSSSHAFEESKSGTSSAVTSLPAIEEKNSQQQQQPAVILRPSVSKLQAMKKFTGRLDRLPATTSTPLIPSSPIASIEPIFAPGMLYLHSSSSPTLSGTCHSRSSQLQQQESFSNRSSINAAPASLSTSKAERLLSSADSLSLLPLSASQQRLDVSYRVRTGNKNAAATGVISMRDPLQSNDNKPNPTTTTVSTTQQQQQQQQVIDEEERLQRELKKREVRPPQLINHLSHNNNHGPPIYGL